MSPALASRFLTTGPPGESPKISVTGCFSQSRLTHCTGLQCFVLWELGSAGAMFARILFPGWFQVRINQMREGHEIQRAEMKQQVWFSEDHCGLMWWLLETSIKNELKPVLALLSFIVVVSSLHHVRCFATPWMAAHQAYLSFTVSWRSLKLMWCHPTISSSVVPFCAS